MKTLTILLLSLSLPGLAVAAGPASFRAPSISLPTVAVPGAAVSLPSPKLPAIMTPAQIQAVYRLPAPTLPVVAIKPGVQLPSRKRGLPGDDDLIGGVPAKLIPPTRPLAPAAAAAAIPQDEGAVKDAKTSDLMEQLERMFDKKGGCWKQPTPVPAHES
jgi:hypothetical protein